MSEELTQVVTIGDVEYKYDELSDAQRQVLAHIGNLSGRIDAAQFELDQLHVCRRAFSDMLKEDLEKEEE